MKLRIVRLSTTMTAMLVLLLAVLCLPNEAVADVSVGHEHEHGFGLSLFSFVKPLGICALGSALVTFGTGLARRNLGRRFLKVHKIFAWLTVGFALCHGTLVLVLY